MSRAVCLFQFFIGFLFCILMTASASTLAQDEEQKSIPTEAEIELVEQNLDVHHPILKEGLLDWLDQATDDPSLRTGFGKALDRLSKKPRKVDWVLGVLRATWVGGATYLAAFLMPKFGADPSLAWVPAMTSGLTDGALMVMTGPLYEWYEGKKSIPLLGKLNGARSFGGMMYRWILMDFAFYLPIIASGVLAGYEPYQGMGVLLQDVAIATAWTTAARGPWELGVSKVMISDAEKAEALGKRYLLPRIYFIGKLKGFFAAATTTSFVLAGKYGVPYMWAPLTLATTMGLVYWIRATLKDAKRFPYEKHNLVIGRVRNKAEKMILDIETKLFPAKARLSRLCYSLFQSFGQY